MPFKSEAQRRHLWMNHPAVAEMFEKETPVGVKLPERIGESKFKKRKKIKARPFKSLAQRAWMKKYMPHRARLWEKKTNIELLPETLEYKPLQKIAEANILEGFVDEMEKQAGIKEMLSATKKAVTGALVGGAIMGSGGKAVAKSDVVGKMLKAKPAHKAVWEQYKINRANKALKKLDFKKFDPKYKADSTIHVKKVVKKSGKGTPLAKLPEAKKNIVDRTIDTAQKFERRTGLKIRKSGVTKKFNAGNMGHGNVKISRGGKLSGEYNLGNLNLKANRKGVKELSGKWGRWKAYTNPQQKKVGVMYRMNF